MKVYTSNFTNASITITGAPSLLTYLIMNQQQCDLKEKNNKNNNNISPNIQHQRVKINGNDFDSCMNSNKLISFLPVGSMDHIFHNTGLSEVIASTKSLRKVKVSHIGIQYWIHHCYFHKDFLSVI